MAIAKVNKLKIIIHRTRLDELLDFLQEEGAVEVIDLKAKVAKDEHSIFLHQAKALELRGEGRDGSDRILSGLSWLIDFLSLVDKTKRYTVKKSEFQNIPERFDYKPILAKTRFIQKSLDEIDSSRKDLSEKREKLLPWIGLKSDLANICRVGYTIRGLASAPSESFDEMKGEFERSGLDVYFEIVKRTERKTFFVFVYMKEDEERVGFAFKKHGLEHVYFPECRGRPRDLLGAVDETLSAIDAKRGSLLEELAILAKHKKDVFILFDHISNSDRKDEASEKFLSTEAVYFVEGWVKKKSAAALKDGIENRFSEAEAFLEEPKAGDNVPVILENKKFLQPFELITKIYGMPAYNEVDPTPFLAPFFFIFFGFCISDAGYGLILALFSIWVLKNFKMGWTGNRFFRLLLYGGVSTIILGALTGGWFGNIIDMLAEANIIFSPLKKAKDAIIVLDPMVEPMKLLVVALTLGVTQIWFGHAVAIYGNIKNRRYLDALFDQGSALVFLFGFTGLILIFLGAISNRMQSVFLSSFAAGAVAILLAGGRANPTIISKLAYGLFVLYNTFSGYISDILSYSRLWALGLVTGVMAATFNLMATLIGGMIPVVGFVFTLGIMLAGHTVSFLMNLLGAFIHPLRLQFVEFFSKFFRGGGREFKPLRLENRFTVIK